jgi:hypothetical protein
VIWRWCCGYPPPRFPMHVHVYRQPRGRPSLDHRAAHEMADRKYDLTEKLGGFLDRHMSLPLLDFLIAKGIYAPAELEQGKLEVLFSTNMVDLAVDIYTARKEKPPAAMLARREEVVGTMNALSAEVQPILEIVQDTVRGARREHWLAGPLAAPPQLAPPAAWTRGLALQRCSAPRSGAALLAANSSAAAHCGGEVGRP